MWKRFRKSTSCIGEWIGENSTCFVCYVFVVHTFCICMHKSLWLVILNNNHFAVLPKMDEKMYIDNISRKKTFPSIAWNIESTHLYVAVPDHLSNRRYIIAYTMLWHCKDEPFGFQLHLIYENSFCCCFALQFVCNLISSVLQSAIVYVYIYILMI